MVMIVGGVPNRALARYGTTVTASATPLIDVENIQDPLLDSAWRSGTLSFSDIGGGDVQAEDYVQFDFKVQRDLSFVSIHGINLLPDTSDEWKVQINDDVNFALEGYDSGYLDPYVRASGTESGWEAGEWNLAMPYEILNRMSVSKEHTFQSQTGRYLRISFRRTRPDAGGTTPTAFTHSDPTISLQGSGGATGNFFQVGHVIAGRSFQPAINMDYGWKMGIEDLSESKITDGGTIFTDLRPRLRNLTLSFPKLSEAEAFVQLLTRWYVIEGHRNRVFVIPQPERPDYYYAQALYGLVRRIEDFTNPAYRRFEHRIEITETL